MLDFCGARLLRSLRSRVNGGNASIAKLPASTVGPSCRTTYLARRRLKVGESCWQAPHLRPLVNPHGRYPSQPLAPTLRLVIPRSPTLWDAGGTAMIPRRCSAAKRVLLRLAAILCIAACSQGPKPGEVLDEARQA